MNLMVYAQSHGTDTRSRSRGALLLSMLPYGLIFRSDAVAWYRGSNGSTKVAELVAEGYIKEYHITGKSKRKSYAIRFFGLAGKGLRYLAATYGEDYPWLKTAVANIDESEEEISFRKVGSNETARMLLRVQSANIFFNRVGSRTIFDRMRDNPHQALCAMRALTNNVTMRHSFLVTLADALEAWLRRVRPSFPQAIPEGNECGEYFDAIEMRVPQTNPYTAPNHLCERTDFLCAEDKGHYRTSYIGVLRNADQVYFVYRSTRDGAVWNGGSIRNNWALVAQQLRRLGLIRTPALVSYSFPAILLVDGVGRGASAFARVCRDNRCVRRGADKALGRGASAVHILPVTECAVQMMRVFLPFSAGGTTFAQKFKQAICDQWPDLFSLTPLDVEMDMQYRGLPCSFGVDMDIKAINHCLDWDAERQELERRGATEQELAGCLFTIVCLPWQVEYYRCLFPDTVTIVAIDVNDMTVLEYAPPSE